MNRLHTLSSDMSELQAVNLAFAALEAELRGEITGLQGQAREAAVELQVLRDDAQRLSGELAAALSNCGALQVQETRQGARIEQLERQLISSARALEELQGSTEDTEAAFTKERERCLALRGALSDADAERLRLTNALTDAEARATEARHREDSARARVEALEASRKLMQQEAVALQEALVMSRNAHRRALDDRDHETARWRQNLTAQDQRITLLEDRLKAQAHAAARHDEELRRQESAFAQAALEQAQRLQALSSLLAAERHQHTQVAAAREMDHRADWKRREQQLHEDQVAACAVLQVRIDELQLALQQQAQLLRAERRSADETLAAFASRQHASMQALEAVHAQRLRQKLTEAELVRGEIMRALQRRYTEALQSQVALTERIAEAEARAARPPGPSPIAQTPVGSMLDADEASTAVVRLQHELHTVRDALQAETQRRERLVHELEAARSAVITLHPVGAMSGQPPADASPTSSPPEHEPGDPEAAEAEARLPTQSPNALSAPPTKEIETMYPTSDLEELLSLHDVAFVRGAYAKVLRRQPDPAGLQIHLDQLRSGTAKEIILLTLAQSEEGRTLRDASALKDTLQQRTANQKRSLFARVLRKLLGLDLQIAFNRVNAVENRLGHQIESLRNELHQSQEHSAALRANVQAVGSELAASEARRAQREAAWTAALAGVGQTMERLGRAIAGSEQRLLGLKAEMSDIGARIDATQGTIQGALSQLEARVEATQVTLVQSAATATSHFERVELLTREEGRLTRAVIDSDRRIGASISATEAPALAMEAIAPDTAAIAHVREMLQPKGILP